MTTTAQIKHLTGHFTKAATGGGPLEFTLSLESEDRMGDVIRSDGWDLTNFKRNPVMLWAHDAGRAPIGKWANVRIEGKELRGTAIFDPEDAFAKVIEGKVRRGFLNAVSVGFRPLEMKQRRGAEPVNYRIPVEFTRVELLECSIVDIPAHQDALLVRSARAKTPVQRPPSWGRDAGDLERIRASAREVRLLLR